MHCNPGTTTRRDRHAYLLRLVALRGPTPLTSEQAGFEVKLIYHLDRLLIAFEAPPTGGPLNEGTVGCDRPFPSKPSDILRPWFLSPDCCPCREEPRFQGVNRASHVVNFVTM